MPFTCAIPLLEAIRVEADEDVEVDSVQDPFNPRVALPLKEEGGKLQHHLVERNHNIEYYVIDRFKEHSLLRYTVVANHRGAVGGLVFIFRLDRIV